MCCLSRKFLDYLLDDFLNGLLHRIGDCVPSLAPHIPAPAIGIALVGSSGTGKSTVSSRIRGTSPDVNVRMKRVAAWKHTDRPKYNPTAENDTQKAGKFCDVIEHAATQEMTNPENLELHALLIFVYRKDKDIAWEDNDWIEDYKKKYPEKPILFVGTHARSYEKQPVEERATCPEDWRPGYDFEKDQDNSRLGSAIAEIIAELGYAEAAEELKSRTCQAPGTLPAFAPWLPLPDFSTGPAPRL